MPAKIDVEAKQLKNLAIDEDNFRKQYKEVDDDILVVFSSPYLYPIEKYRFYLLKNSVKKNLDIGNYYRPDYVSYENYGTTCLWYLLLYMNDMNCIEEFATHEIVIPSYSAIIDTARNIVSNEVITLGQQEEVSSTLLKLYESKIKPNVDSSEEEESQEVEESTYKWARQRFTLSAGQAAVGYLDLAYTPIPTSITLRTEHAGNHIYEVDWNLILSSDGRRRRISWRDQDCPHGTGLLTRLQTGMIVEIQYAKQETL